MIKVEFRFNIDDRVRTPFMTDKEFGIIEMLGVDSGGKKTYYVKGPAYSQWFKEEELHFVK